MENNPAGLHKTDMIEDCFRRADELSRPNGSRYTGMMCDMKDLRRIVLLVKTVRDLQPHAISDVGIEFKKTKL